MKKIVLLLCAVLAVSTLFYGCGKDKEAASDASSSSEPTASASMPTTEAEIIGHNLKIDEAAIDLIQFKAPAAGAKTATIKTTAGDIKLVLFPDEAPKAVENFIALAEKGYYNGLSFYEVAPTVHISTGDPKNDGTGGESSFDGKPFPDEYSLNLWHFNGAVAMDNGGIPDTNASRFFIVQNTEISDELLDKMMDGGFPEKVINQYLETGGVPNYDFRDTVFGHVIEGMDVVEKIAAAPRDEENKPKEDITITSIEIAAI